MMRGLSARQVPNGTWELVRVHSTTRWVVVQVILSGIPDEDTAVCLAKEVVHSLVCYHYVSPLALLMDRFHSV